MEKMSKEARYYVPKIEEFHVGFYFQRYGNDYETEQVDQYDWHVYDDLLHMDEVRVKYLDREDIEAEGWQKQTDTQVTCYEIWVGRRLYEMRKSHPEYYGEDKYVIDFIEKEGKGNRFTCFSGTIKNRSELRKVMEMLGVTK